MQNNIYLGDIHGQFNIIIGWINQNKHLNNCNIIQVGDFGIGFRPKQEHHEMKILNDKLKSKGHNLFVIRGNHDNPKYFDQQHDYEHIKFLPDYTILNLDGYNHLFVGGAISIDRILRTENQDYWSEESFNLNLEKLKNITNIDVLVTHTTMTFTKPLFFSQIVYDFIMKDNALKFELEEERNKIDLMWGGLNSNDNKIKYHFYGHFHFPNIEQINETKHKLLDINEFYSVF